MKLIPAKSCDPKHERVFTAGLSQNYNLAISCSGDLPPEGELTEPEITPEEKDTSSTCAFCKNDFEGVTLNKLSVYPICDNCKINLDKNIFPTWVKLFFGGVLLIVLFSIFWNWRFYSAYLEIKHSNAAFQKSDINGAAKLMTEAADNVPESTELIEMAAYFKGIDLLIKDKSTAALAELSKCKDLDPDFHVNRYVLQAEMGAGYDQKNYDLFLSAAKGALQLDTTQSQAWASVSSAYACLYAQKSVDSLKRLSVQYLNKAQLLDSKSAEAKEYYGVIHYRLDTKQIIGRAEFNKKFPHGYTSPNL